MEKCLRSFVEGTGEGNTCMISHFFWMVKPDFCVVVYVVKSTLRLFLSRVSDF